MKNHAAIVLREGDKFLFVQRAATKKSLPNIWAFPSGTMEEGESAEATVIREAKEELGIDIVVKGSMDTVQLPEFNVVLHFMICESKSSSILFDPSEIQAIVWMTFEEFFATHSDDQIGHGLIYLRKNLSKSKSYTKSPSFV